MTEMELDAADARFAARIPLGTDSIRTLQKSGVCMREARIADFYAGANPENQEDSAEGVYAWRDRWTTAYNAACWSKDQP